MRTADYAVSWPLWSAYIDATKRVFGASDPLRVRAAHEEAVKAMGAHVVEGHLVWMSYIAHEEGSGVISTAELEHLKSRMASTALSSCNNGLLNEDARLFLKACEPFEARIATVLRQHGAGGDVERAEPGGGALGDCTELAAAWMDYIDFALKWKKGRQSKTWKEEKGDRFFPLALRKCLHERAVSACCLSEPLWVAYAHFASSRDYDLDVHARAVRNCPWSSPLWTSYMRALERSGATYERISAAFRGGSRRVASDASALLDVAMSYCEWCRRNAPERLKSAFAKARRTVEAAFPGWSAGSIALQKYEAHCEAHVLKNPMLCGEYTRVRCGAMVSTWRCGWTT